MTENRISDLLAMFPQGGWEDRRRLCILHLWPDSAVRAAEQDVRRGKPGALAQYDADVAAIKAAIPSPSPLSFKEALAELSAAYRLDVSSLQASWVSVAVSGGVDEATKKATIVADIAARKAQFTADYAALRSLYGV